MSANKCKEFSIDKSIKTDAIIYADEVIATQGTMLWNINAGIKKNYPDGTFLVVAVKFKRIPPFGGQWAFTYS